MTSVLQFMSALLPLVGSGWWPSPADANCLEVEGCNCEATVQSPLSVVNCRHGSFIRVPSFNVQQQQVFYELTLADNQIRSIAARAFGKIQVIVLDLTDNPLTTIDKDAFVGLNSTLRQLKLSLSSEAQFPVAALTVITHLDMLSLSGFSGVSLPPNATSALSRLTQLHLVNGGLTIISPGDLAAQSMTLRVLVLSGNVLRDVPSTALAADVPRLTSLDLSANRIGRVGPKALSGLHFLEAVDLSNNGLVEAVDRMAFDGVSDTLKSLRMSSCQLTDRSLESLRTLVAVNELHLQRNSISSLPDGLFSACTSLRLLNLDFNRLTTLTSSSFTDLAPALHILYLRYNQPAHGPSLLNALSTFLSLQELYLDGITSFQLNPTSIVQFSARLGNRLRVLSLRDTGIGDEILWSIVPMFPRLQTLLASNCSLTKIPDLVFQNSSSLKFIDLSFNAIGPTLTKSSMFGLEPSLRTLALRGNRLKVIDRCAFYGFQTFSWFQTSLGSNPLQCDCSLIWMYKELNSELTTSLQTSQSSIQRSKLGLLTTWTCDDGRRLEELTDDDFVNCTSVAVSNCSRSPSAPEVNGTSGYAGTTLNVSNTDNLISAMEGVILPPPQEDFPITREPLDGLTWSLTQQTEIFYRTRQM